MLQLMKSLRLVVPGLGLLMLIGAPSAEAQVIKAPPAIPKLRTVKVPQNAPTIQAGIDMVCNNGTVIVADGIYSGPGNRDIDFKGKKIKVMSQNGPFSTIVDCQNFGRGFIFDSGETSASVLIGFTIENGVDPFSGGGIYCVGSSPKIKRCIIRNNRSAFGAGVYCSGGAPLFLNCLVVDNSSAFSPRFGGGFYCNQTDLILRNCTVANNDAFDDGGGIYASGGTTDVVLESTVLWGNTVQNGAFPEQIQIVVAATVSVDYCNVEGGEADVEISSGSLNYGVGNIDADPSFAAPLSGDYTLLNDSPCIDRGDPGYLPAAQRDIDGDPRLFGAFVDIGADEYASCDSVFQQYHSSDVPIPIPDATPGGILSTVEVPSSGFADGPTGLFVDVTHPNPSDLLVVLYPPGCGPGQSCGVIPCGLIPQCSFPVFFNIGSFFDGVQVGGTWTLQVIDQISGSAGTLEAWRLDLEFTLCQ